MTLTDGLTSSLLGKRVLERHIVSIRRKGKEPHFHEIRECSVYFFLKSRGTIYVNNIEKSSGKVIRKL